MGFRMHNRMKVLVASLALAAATPAAAQFTFSQPGQPLPPTQQLQIWNNVARVNLGVSFYNSTWYSCYAWGWTAVCSTDAWASYIPFTFGPQIDLNLDGPNNISVGFNVLLGSVSGRDFQGNQRSGSVTVWEPTLDYVAKFGPPTQDTVGRFRLGGGMNRIGVGLDLVIEAGGYQGYWIGGLQLLVSPEFHF
jgi:hypothetical protein